MDTYTNVWEKYRISTEIEAVKLTEGNLHFVAEWCGGYVDENGEGVYTKNKNQWATIGAYISRDEHMFYVFSSSYFERTFEKVEKDNQFTQEELEILSLELNRSIFCYNSLVNFNSRTQIAEPIDLMDSLNKAKKVFNKVNALKEANGKV